MENVSDRCDGTRSYAYEDQKTVVGSAERCTGMCEELAQETGDVWGLGFHLLSEQTQGAEKRPSLDVA